MQKMKVDRGHGKKQENDRDEGTHVICEEETDTKLIAIKEINTHKRT